MYTFNVALIFGQHDQVYTLVCASEDPINDREVIAVAHEAIQKRLPQGGKLDEAIDYVANCVKQEYGCETVVVKADAICNLWNE